MYFEEYLTDLFTYVLNMSITGSYVILAVLAARLLLRKAPKKISYLLWIAPFLRLISPITLSSRISIFNLDLFNSDFYSSGIQEYVPFNYAYDATPDFSTGFNQSQAIIPSTFNALEGADYNSVNPLHVLLFVLACIWVTGIVAMLIYAAVSFIKTKTGLRTATRLESNVFESEGISSPFVIGIIRPKIYLPYALSEKEKEYIILHERTHIKNLDHVAKILAFFVLTLHWFNPLCYLAFTLMSRDMEMACDEAVLKQNESIRKDYSTSLLSFATNKRLPSPSPLCFGESGIKQRIKNTLSWKKPKTWIVAVALVFLCVFFISVATNPQSSMSFTSNPEGPLNDAVSQMILDEADTSIPYFCATEGHIIFGTTQYEDEVTVYGYMSYSTMNFMNGYLSDYVGSGGAMPFVATFREKDGFYKLEKVNYPEDGMRYGDSIREMFPAQFEKKALKPQKYFEYINKQELAYAEAALEKAGISCEIINTPDTDVVLMSDYKVQEKIDYSGKVSTHLYPDFIGVTMHGDTVYERRADTEKGRYYLASYQNGSTQATAHAFDAQGNYIGQEVIPVKDFFLYENPEKDTELYYIFDESKLTTHAIMLEEDETLPTEDAAPEPTTRLISSETAEEF